MHREDNVSYVERHVFGKKSSIAKKSFLEHLRIVWPFSVPGHYSLFRDIQINWFSKLQGSR